jgi:4-diphosphocytidyl-2-C-methyl-D-erythritol kinase
MSVLVPAPAKLTVSLRVLGRRPDGYHDLSAEMVSLSLADELWIDEGGSGVAVEGPEGAGVRVGPDELVTRALAACGRRAGVRLVKRIPVGGGLGGGSADAAAVLRWAGVADPGAAAALGADVPFCLVGGRARVEGLGERVLPLEPVPRDFVLLLPPFGASTPAAYAAWDDGVRGGGPNELAAAALAVEPRLAPWRDALARATGATPVLAGSGSTWFVQGRPGDLGLEGRDVLRLGEETARLVAVHTVGPEAGEPGPG